MTTQATAAVGTAEPKTIKGSPRWGDLLLRIVAGLVLFYLFLPIFVIVLFSFNNPRGKFNYSWQGFTLNNWAHPFKYPALTDALKLSLNVAAVSTAFALVLGTLVAVALVRQRFRGRTAVDTFLVLPLTAPEVVMGAALLTLFLDFGWAAGYTTILIAHIAFEISFIVTVTIRVHFDVTVGEAKNTKLPPVDVVATLVEALSQTGNWRPKLPANSNQHVVLREPPPGSPTGFGVWVRKARLMDPIPL